MATTGQGFLGCNMFAYCLNNPIIMGDDEGMDAVVLIDDEGAFGFGHVGFLAQDDEGTWWHFYWGAQNPYISFVPWGVENAATYQEYHGPVSLDGINQSGVYSTTDSYDRLFRLSGDFSDSVEKGKVYGKNKYNLYTRNCSEVTFSLLSDAPNANQQVLKTASRVSGPKFAYQLAKNSITPPPSTRRNARNKCGGQRNLLV